MKKELREKVFNKYNKKCAYCGEVIEYRDMQVDHLTPKRLSHYYASERMKKELGIIGFCVGSFENLMPSCRRCNHYKRAYTLEEFRTLMQSLHERIASNYINKVAIDYDIIILKPFTGEFYFEKFKSEGSRSVKGDI